MEKYKKQGITIHLQEHNYSLARDPKEIDMGEISDKRI